MVLVLCKSTGAIVYGLFVLPFAALSRRWRFFVPLALAAFVFTYPLLRGAQLVPTERMVELFTQVSEERANSLWFRFDNEDQLLARAREKLLFGWGGYSRQRVYDPETGEDLSVTDGHWIVDMGMRGLVGFVALFGLLLWPIVMAYRARKRIADPDDLTLVSGMALIVAINAVDLLPNGLFSYLPYFYAGILAGVLPRPIKRASGSSARPAAPR